MNVDRYRITAKGGYKAGELPTDSSDDSVDKEIITKKTKENLAEIGALQDRLYADGKEGVIVILQALDAAGKDSTVKHVMSGINPQGVDVWSFKTPSTEELSHDFLWRVNKCLPARGKIALFNRSYYEDVLVVQVRDIQKTYSMAERVVGQPKDEFFRKRYRHIRHYEEYLYDNSYRIVKIFLNVSKKEQKKRFLERIDDPEKNWKFSAGDLAERALWDEYQKAFENVINETSTEECPWYVLPADQKWYTRYLVSEILLDTLKKIGPRYPVMAEEDRKRLAACRLELTDEKA